MAADCSSVSVELLDPTTCKCTELVKHLLLNCVAVMRVKVFFQHIVGKFSGHINSAISAINCISIG